MHKPCSYCQRYKFQHLWKTISEEIPVNIPCNTLWQNMWIHQTITHNTSPHTNPDLQLVPIMYYTTWVLPCTLMLVVEIYDAISTSYLICEEHPWDKERIGGLLNKPLKKFTGSGSSKDTRPSTLCKWQGYGSCSWSTLWMVIQSTDNTAATAATWFPS
jgi:hypothetical protein